MIKFSIETGKGGEVIIDFPSSLSELPARALYLLYEVFEKHKGAQVPTGADPMVSLEWLLFVRDVAKTIAQPASLAQFIDNIPFDKKSGFPLVVGVVNSFLLALDSHKPEPIPGFEYQGKTFVLPLVETKSIGDLSVEEYGADLTLAQVVELYQKLNLLGSKDESGEPRFRDARLLTDLAVVACFAREKLPDGTLEALPLDMNAYSDFVLSRIAYFDNLPADVTLNAGFFLVASTGKLLNHFTRRYYSSLPRLRKV